MKDLIDFLEMLIYLPWEFWKMACHQVDPRMPDIVEASTFAGAIFAVVWPCLGLVLGMVRL